MTLARVRPRRRAVQRGKVVRQRTRGSAQPPQQSRNLEDPALYYERLERQTYLTIPELRDFGRFPSLGAVHMWLLRHPQVPKLGSGKGGRVLVNRRDFEKALQPREDGRHE